MAALTDADRDAVDRQLARLQGRPGPLLEVLHGIQAELGFIPEAAVPVIAEALNLSRAEVHGVITFYHYFRHSPPGRHAIQVCRAEACQAMGGEAFAAHVQRRLSIGFHETTADGAFSLDPVYCLGNCACSPAIMIDGELHGRLTAERFDALVARLEAAPAPAAARNSSAPVPGAAK